MGDYTKTTTYLDDYTPWPEGDKAPMPVSLPDSTKVVVRSYLGGKKFVNAPAAGQPALVFEDGSQTPIIHFLTRAEAVALSSELVAYANGCPEGVDEAYLR